MNLNEEILEELQTTTKDLEESYEYLKEQVNRESTSKECLYKEEVMVTINIR